VPPAAPLSATRRRFSGLFVQKLPAGQRDDESLNQFIMPKGGIKAYAARFSRCLRRGAAG
jgi:hypothetical protein